MKVEIVEYDNSFNIEFVAEDVKDASFLIRLKMNALKNQLDLNTNVCLDGKIYSSMWFNKRKQSTASIKG